MTTLDSDFTLGLVLKGLVALILGISITVLSKAVEAKESPIFSFTLFSESQSLDPQLSSTPTSNYLFTNLYRGLYRYNEVKGLFLDGAKSCIRTPLALTCTLQKDGKWSNGEPIRASDYVAAFQKLITPEFASPQSDLLFHVKNALEIWRKERPPEQLGVSAPNEWTLRVEFSSEDSEFEYKLIHPALSPLPPGGYLRKENATAQITSGPYKISEWKGGSWVKLENNEHYRFKGQRPRAQAFFVDDDLTALNLYETKKLSFLRRVVAAQIPRFKSSPEFHQIGMARFDYIGFGPQLLEAPKLREALVKGVNFPQFKNLFDTRTPPGCPSLPPRLMDKVVCQKFAPLEAKAAFPKAQADLAKEFKFSKLGGDDIARAAEWFQGQWKSNLGLQLQIKPEEQTVYLRNLRTNPPPIFRKGVGLDRPTCLGGLEIFTRGHPENLIRLDDNEYEKKVRAVAEAKTEQTRKVACRKAVEHLLKSHRLIPLGEMHFSIMVRPEFKGWSLNSLNQLDLTDLAVTSPRPQP